MKKLELSIDYYLNDLAALTVSKNEEEIALCKIITEFEDKYKTKDPLLLKIINCKYVQGLSSNETQVKLGIGRSILDAMINKIINEITLEAMKQGLVTIQLRKDLYERLSQTSIRKNSW